MEPEVKDDAAGEKKTPRKPSPAPANQAPATRPRQKQAGARDIHVGRRKDPPDLYFKSGLQYFKNADFMNALKNFTFARTADPKPEYFLWMGKTYRRLEQYDKMLEILNELLVRFPDSDVSDDAVFELANYYQTINDYDMAMKKYTEVAEQYPFGMSFSTGEELRDLARQQRQLLRAELVSALKVLGYTGQTLEEACNKFQLLNNLPEDGRPTRQTVTMIKEQYQQKLQSDNEKSVQLEYKNRGLIASAVIAVVLGFNIWLLIAVRMKISRTRAHLESLISTLADLRTDTI